MICVMDASQPNKCLERFTIGTKDTNIICITSVPGRKQENHFFKCCILFFVTHSLKCIVLTHHTRSISKAFEIKSNKQ